MTRPGRIEFFEGKSGKWYWRHVAANGKVVADGGQGYSDRSGVRRGARRRMPEGTPLVFAKGGSPRRKVTRARG